MKKTAIALFALMSFAGAAFAADVIDLPAKNGNISFPHKMHQEMLKDCTKCHSSAAGGKIEGFGKDVAHNTCKKCHSEGGKGPTKCGECHKK